MEKVDLNCDIGESTDLHSYNIQTDLELLKWVSSINVAAGFHAGDAHTMHQLTEAALEAGVAVGLHPSFNDRENFGRRSIELAPMIVYDLVLYQMGALHAFLHVYGARMHHVKPHGGLYHVASKNRLIADAICKAIHAFDKDVLVYALSGSELIAAAQDAGLKPVSEVFADRSYQHDGSLLSRTEPNAVVTDSRQIIQQLLAMIRQGKAISVTGEEVKLKAETVCIHSDTPGAIELARFINETLQQENVVVRQP